MLSIHILCVGKLKERFYIDAAQEYQKRLSPYCKLTLTELPEEKLPKNPSPAQIQAALSREAQAIRAKIPPRFKRVALCVEGRERSSEELSRLVTAENLCFLIGGSYGLDDSLKAEAADRLSMSPMTFPHHLARVMLLEQIYRACQINAGTRYHK